MIDIYTEKKESKDWILQNDLYFNLNTGNEEMSQNGNCSEPPLSKYNIWVSI